MEESEGFEPSVPLPALRISSATLSTTQPTLLAEADAPSDGLRIMQASLGKNAARLVGAAMKKGALCR